MRIKTILVILSLVIIPICFGGYIVSAQSPNFSDLINDTLKIEDLTKMLDAEAGKIQPTYVYVDGRQREVYWDLNLRDRIFVPMLNEILGNIKNSGGQPNFDVYANEIINILKTECDDQCEANMADSRTWGSQFVTHSPYVDSGGESSSGGCSGYRCGYGNSNPQNCGGRSIFNNVCEQFHCAITPSDPINYPYNEASLDMVFNHIEQYTTSSVPRVCGWDTTLDRCTNFEWTEGQSAPFGDPEWCAFRPCTKSDHQLKCLQDAGLAPQLLTATNTTMSFMIQLIGNGSDGTGFMGAISGRYVDEITNILNEYMPNFSGGTSEWDRKPRTGVDYGAYWGNQTGSCYNQAVGGCSCSDVLPINGPMLTYEELQDHLSRWEVESPSSYCVNNLNEKHCAATYNWKDSRGDEIGMRNIFSSRASYPGVYDPKNGDYYQGGLCTEDDKSSGSGDGGTDLKTATDANFWYLQARYHEDNFRITFPALFGDGLDGWKQLTARGPGRSDYVGAKGDDKLLGDYGGCDDRSNILYAHNTTAECEEKSSSSPKCSKPTDQDFASWACAEDGSVIDQCDVGTANARNNSCQVCGPIMCGALGMFSDTNTVRKDVSTGALTRHYGHFPAQDTTATQTIDGEVKIEDNDSREQILSYRTIGCKWGEGSNCDNNNDYGIIFNDSVFGARNGTVIQDRTCASFYGSEDWIVDPCSQVGSDADSRLNNNWNGSRKCYSACCVDADHNGSCDEYEVDGYEPGTCGAPGNSGVCAQTTYDQLVANNYHSFYAYTTCAPADLNFRGARRVNNPAEVCTRLGETDERYKKSVGKDFTYTVNAGTTADTNCYLCGCTKITGGSGGEGKSGWWAQDARFVNSQGSCNVNQGAGLTPEQKCDEIYQPASDGTPGHLGLAYARDLDGRTALLRNSGAYNLDRTNCVRCRCVPDDGICDGCYPSDPLGVKGNSGFILNGITYQTSCYNLTHDGLLGLDPDCHDSSGNPGCPAGPCDPNTCLPGTMCEEACKKKGGVFDPDDNFDNGPGCGYCTVIPETPHCGDGVCNDGESCGNCRSDCGDCPNAVCPDGYGPLCDGAQYYDPVAGETLPNCRRCQTPGGEPGDSTDDCAGGKDGYCNPLCATKDNDCEPLKPPYDDGIQCPAGYSSGQDGCGGMSQDSNSPKVGSSHPLYKNCCVAGAEKCTPDVISGYQQACDNIDRGGVDWEPMLKSEQQRLYMDSLCYGYQLIGVENDFFTGTTFKETVYDYYQRAAWMNTAPTIDSMDFQNERSIGGYRRCRSPVEITSNNTNCDVVCVPKDHNLIVMSCSEIDARYPDEFTFDMPTDGSTYLFLPDMARSAGNNAIIVSPGLTGMNSHVDRSADKRCGRYYRTYPQGGQQSGNGDLNGDGTPNDWQDKNEAASYLYTDWWQAGGSAYGNAGVGNYGENDYLVNNPGDYNDSPATKDYVSENSYQYALTGGTGICAYAGNIQDGNDEPNGYDYSLGSGLQVTGTGEPTTLTNYRTYRSPANSSSNDLAAQSGYTYQATQQREFDWNYYISKFDYQGARSGDQVGGDAVAGGATIYKFGNGAGVDVKLSTKDANGISLETAISNGYTSGHRVVVFINGNFTLDRNITAGGGVNNGYLALIINGTLIIGSDVGTPFADPSNACKPNINCNPSLDAVVIAEGLQIHADHTKYDRKGIDPLFNSNFPLYCDKRLVLSGAYSFWGGNDIVFTRSLLGCGFKKPLNGYYPNDTDTLNIYTGQPVDGDILHKNELDQYCRTSGSNGVNGSSMAQRNGNGYWDYKPYPSSGMYNNYNRLFPATQIISNPDLINRTPGWMRESSGTRLEVQ